MKTYSVVITVSCGHYHHTVRSANLTKLQNEVSDLLSICPGGTVAKVIAYNGPVFAMVKTGYKKFDVKYAASFKRKSSDELEKLVSNLKNLGMLSGFGMEVWDGKNVAVELENARIKLKQFRAGGS